MSHTLDFGLRTDRAAAECRVFFAQFPETLCLSSVANEALNGAILVHQCSLSVHQEIRKDVYLTIVLKIIRRIEYPKCYIPSTNCHHLGLAWHPQRNRVKINYIFFIPASTSNSTFKSMLELLIGLNRNSISFQCHDELSPISYG
ncbi:hypothetical protein B0H14DRAFT_2568072 [Mycena olivaceomarginata]|nr:hypothetical protein B0H14DRAFT_2568072 [Mycena olivaceomarginata]